MLRGATKITLDSKGRLVIPTRYRERLMSEAEGHLIVTVDRDCCLLIYPQPDWQEVERMLVGLPSLNEPSRTLQRLMLGYATDIDMDGHGRILLTRELREFATLDKQAMLIGQGKRFELWNEERWNARRDGWLAGDSSTLASLPPELERLSF